jgi:selenium metabolism protein YedF
VERIVDARGLACPQPLLSTKRALEEIGEGLLITIVDNEIARDNVMKFVQSRGLRAEVEQKGSDYYIYIHRSEGTELRKAISSMSEEVVVISSVVLGRGDEDLGRLLMQSFLGTLAQAESLPRKILLINSGVKLACEGSPVLDSLMAIEKRGVEIAACGTCLDYYGLRERLCVGSVTNMYSIVSALAEAEKVINF